MSMAVISQKRAAVSLVYECEECPTEYDCDQPVITFKLHAQNFFLSVPYRFNDFRQTK